MNLEQLRISNKLSSENIFPEFPIFNGKEIVLDRYCLHSWVSELKEIRCLDLYECETLETLPSMPNLLTLKLRNLPSLRIIPTFPKCHSIQLEELGALTSIHQQPKLKNLDVSGITDEIIFKELDGHNFKFVSISSSCITNFTWARNSYSIDLQDVNGVETLITDSIIPPEQRVCKLSMFYEIIDFSIFSKFKSLKIDLLEYFGHEDDPTQLWNIQDLFISGCNEYENTDNLHNIQKRLCLENLTNLVILRNLQNIPLVALSMLPMLEDFSGLGNNDHVYIYRVPHLEAAVEEFVLEKEAGRAELHSMHGIFSTIRTLTIIKPRDNVVPIRRGLGAFSFDWERLFDYDKIQLW